MVEGAHARRAGKLPPDERRDLILSVLARFFGPRAADPKEYVERDWAAEEWSRGCYGGRFGTGGWTGYGEALREAVGCVHWAGTETAFRREGRPRSTQRLKTAASETRAK